MLIRTALFCSDKLHIQLVVGDMLEQNFFSIPDLDVSVENIIPLMSNDIEIFLQSIYSVKIMYPLLGTVSIH